MRLCVLMMGSGHGPKTVSEEMKVTVALRKCVPFSCSITGWWSLLFQPTLKWEIIFGTDARGSEM